MKRIISLIVLMISATGISAQEPEKEALGLNFYEEKPAFKGGGPELLTQWVKERQVYPRKALELGLQGRVTIRFTITETGKLKNVETVSGVHKSLDKESLRLVKSTAGLWTPGKDQHLEPCSRTLLFPVIWELPEEEFACLAQTDESRHEISVAYGYITLPQAIDLLGAGAATVLGGLLTGMADVMVPGDLEYLERIDNGGTGGFSFQYLYSLNRTIKLGGTVCYERTWGKWNNGDEYIVHYPAIMATSKFMWFNHEHFGMYSKLSLGMMLLLGGKNEAKPIPMLAVQASSVCMEFGGEALRGFLETGWGNQGLLNFGVKFSY